MGREVPVCFAAAGVPETSQGALILRTDWIDTVAGPKIGWGTMPPSYWPGDPEVPRQVVVGLPEDLRACLEQHWSQHLGLWSEGLQEPHSRGLRWDRLL